jgi:hypothetical protein
VGRWRAGLCFGARRWRGIDLYVRARGGRVEGGNALGVMGSGRNGAGARWLGHGVVRAPSLVIPASSVSSSNGGLA